MVRALLAALPARDHVRAFERALLAADSLPAMPSADPTPAPVPVVPSTPVLAPPTRVPAPTPAADAAALPPPPWVRRPDQWARLPRLTQAALAGATEEDGQIVGANPFLTKQIQTRYGPTVAALRDEER